MGIQHPIGQMSGAAWNILDARGCRIAWCGYDDDHEGSGPSIAAELIAAVNASRHWKVLAEELAARLMETVNALDCDDPQKALAALAARDSLPGFTPEETAAIASVDIETMITKQGS